MDFTPAASSDYSRIVISIYDIMDKRRILAVTCYQRGTTPAALPVRAEGFGGNPTMAHPQNPIFAVTFHEVSKSYHHAGRSVTALAGISGSIPRSAIVTLVGPSGSGKSTLLSLCNLLTSPDAGEVIVDGQDVRLWAIPALRRRVGLVFQSPVMFPGTVLDNLTYGPRLRGEPLQNPEEFMHRVGLPEDLLVRNASALSGGQQQRVALARTMANDPDIILLDEVTSSLDPGAARDVGEWILRIHQERQTTLLWVTHNLEQARRVGHYTWFMEQGHLVEAADTAQFFSEPKEAKTHRFLNRESSEGAP